MDTDILKQLFYELFDVNHLMNDLIDEFEQTDYGDAILISFYVSNIKDEFERKDLLEHKERFGASCLNSLSETEYKEFCEYLYQ